MPILRRGGRGGLDDHLKTNNRFKKRDITDFLNTDYKEYAKYVVATRCCPGMDGLKVGARKVMHAAFNGAMKNGNKVKMINLIGDVYSYTMFMHGDAGLTSSIFTKSAEFSDNLNPLEIDGQHGHLRSPNAQSAPRYLSIKLSKYAKILKEDYNLLEYVFDEGEYLEPTVYLPIIPLVLASSQIGMAPGYKFQCSVGYNPLDIIDACIEFIKKAEIKTILHPYVRGIKSSKFEFQETSGRWINYGEYSIDLKHDIVNITELPYDVTFKDFEDTLNDLMEKGTIRDWKNYSKDDKLDYKVIFPKAKLSVQTQPNNINKLEKMLKLFTIIQPNILNVIDEQGRVRYFEDEYKLIEHYVKWRLTKYQDRKNKLVEILEDKYKKNSDVCKFIELVNEGKIKIQNRKRLDIVKELKGYGLPDKVLTVEISKLTDEEKADLLKKNEEIRKELEYIKSTEIKDMYLDDLKKLRKELEGDFKG